MKKTAQPKRAPKTLIEKKHDAERKKLLRIKAELDRAAEVCAEIRKRYDEQGALVVALERAVREQRR